MSDLPCAGRVMVIPIHAGRHECMQRSACASRRTRLAERKAEEWIREEGSFQVDRGSRTPHTAIARGVLPRDPVAATLLENSGFGTIKVV